MGFRESLGAALGQLACSSAVGYRTLTQANPVAGLLLGGAVPQLGSYLMERLYCNKDPYERPYRPGPCPYGYNVTITYRIQGHPSPQFNGTFTLFRSLWGPIGPASYVETDVDSPGGRTIVNVNISAHGEFNGPRSPVSVKSVFPPGEFHELATLVILNVEAIPIDPNSPADCGGVQPPPPYDPDDFTFNVDINIDNPTSPRVTLPFIAIVAPFFVNIRGELNMPVKFTLAPTANLNLGFDFNFDASLNLTTGDTNIDFLPPSGDGQPPPQVPNSPVPNTPSPNKPVPPAPPGIPDNEPPADDPDRESVIIAAIVTVNEISILSSPTVIFQEDNPDVYVPTLGLISFGARSDSSGFGWTNDIPIKNRQAYIPCPIPEGASRVLGTPRPGIDWTITPVYSNSVRLAGGS